MKQIKPKNYVSHKKLIFEWTDKKKCFIHYSMLKFHVRHGMIVERIHEIISFKQSEWLEIDFNFNTKKRNKPKKKFEKHFYKLLINAAFGEFFGNFRNHLNLKFIKKVDIKNNIKDQPALTFKGLHKSYKNCDGYTIQQNHVVSDKAIYVGFAILELIKSHMYETFHDKLQPCFGQENLQLHYADTDGMILTIKTENNIKDLKN